MNATQSYDAVLAALASHPEVSRSEKKGFGFGALMVRGKLFASLRGEGLLLKLPAARVAMLVASGEGDPFDANKGRPMKEWVVLRPDAVTSWLEMASEALAFVGG